MLLSFRLTTISFVGRKDITVQYVTFLPQIKVGGGGVGKKSYHKNDKHKDDNI